VICLFGFCTIVRGVVSVLWGVCFLGWVFDLCLWCVCVWLVCGVLCIFRVRVVWFVVWQCLNESFSCSLCVCLCGVCRGVCVFGGFV